MHSTAVGLASLRSGGEAGANDRVAAIYQRIFETVMDQRLPPGAKLPEEQLGALFGASRTIVRSALQALAHDHIVTIERHRGAFISAPSTAEAQDIFHSRRLIEAGIALEVAETIAPEDVARLNRLLEEEAEALERDDRQGRDPPLRRLSHGDRADSRRGRADPLSGRPDFPLVAGHRSLRARAGLSLRSR